MAQSSDGGIGTIMSKNWRKLALGTALLGALALSQPFLLHAQTDDQNLSGPGDEPPPPPDGSDDSAGAPPPPPPPDEGDPNAPPATEAGPAEVDPIDPGEAVVTRFSHTTEQQDANGAPQTVIDLSGISASVIDVRRPGDPPAGQHWIDEPQHMPVTAGEVGQVFGVTLDDDETPAIFLSATAAFGLHRIQTGPNQSDWMPGMWGPDAGPGSIFKIDADNGFVADKFTDVMLNGRANSGAALGNIAYDRWHKQVFVSDLETGMIHRLDASSGKDLGYYDHGTAGRPSFLDGWTGAPQSLPPVAFDPASKAQTDNCPSDFSKTPECWNIADFRRRIWGLGVRRDGSGEVRLYYSVWGSDALGNPAWAQAGDDRRNSVWSVKVGDNGGFDTSSVRREFFMPAFWPQSPGMGDKAGNSNAVSDIAFPDCGPQNAMVVSERGGLRNLGLDKPEPFARPHEARVLRYELGNDGVWRPKGRYDVGFYDRQAKEGAPFIFANAAGGAAFDYGFDGNGGLDTSKPDQSVWMTGDALCSPNGPCTSVVTGEHDDKNEVHGLQGTPADAVVPVEPDQASSTQPAASGPQNFGALDQSYLIDTDINMDENGARDDAGLARNDATKIGDVAIYQVCQPVEPLPAVEPIETGGAPPPSPPLWPVHTLAQSHEKQASSGHNVDRSWHQRNASWHSVDRSWHWKSRSWHSRNQTWHWREGSWHDARRSWHWKSQSWHSRNQTWHWREGSWHQKQRSWHRKGASLHDRRYSWHAKERSWHLKERSYHDRNRSWGEGHIKGRTWHNKNQTWGGQHVKGRTWHIKGQTWGGQHQKGRTYHKKGQTWGDPIHVRGKTFHVKGRTWSGPDHVKGRTFHNKGRTWGNDHTKGKTYHKKGQTWGGGDQPNHVKGKTFHVKGKTWGGGDQPNHVKGRTFHQKGKTWGGAGGDDKPNHMKGKTFHKKGKSFDGDGGKTKPVHTRSKSRADQGKTKPVHTRSKSRADQDKTKPVHTRSKSRADQGDSGKTKPVHTRSRSQAVQGGSKPQKAKSLRDQGVGQQKTKSKPQQGSGGQSRPAHERQRSLLLQKKRQQQ